MKHTYKFSIVTAVYNTAEYLEEMIEGVVNQDIGFKDNVQLILVDDGSNDDSVSICKKYEDTYPNNINVICLSHSGVSAARNEGIKLVQGKYVNFLDSDDKLEVNALSEVEKFFKEYEEVDLVAIPLYFFDNDTGEHILNYKFKENRIIDIHNEYMSIQLSSSSTFIESNVLKKYKFSELLTCGEDAKLVTEIICLKGKYGVVNKSKYWYRRRKSNDSAIQNGRKSMEWYKDYIKYFSKEVLNLIEKEQLYRRYIEYLVMYDLQWKINDYRKLRINSIAKDRVIFIDGLNDVIKKIGIRAILKQRNLKFYRKIMLILMKYNLFYMK